MGILQQLFKRVLPKVRPFFAVSPGDVAELKIIDLLATGGGASPTTLTDAGEITSLVSALGLDGPTFNARLQSGAYIIRLEFKLHDGGFEEFVVLGKDRLARPGREEDTVRIPASGQALLKTYL